MDNDNRNWALGENGASVVDTSGEAAHVASSASNLLLSKPDLLWITGAAPQHVTLRLSASHPPLHYVGWHVWHDYVTNPRRVEVSAGASALTLRPLLVCEALPGAGTQMWRLPQPIVPAQTFVRFRILDTFGPGPTYMNNVMLLASDPGPQHTPGGTQGKTAGAEAAAYTSPAAAAAVPPVLVTPGGPAGSAVSAAAAAASSAGAAPLSGSSYPYSFGPSGLASSPAADPLGNQRFGGHRGGLSASAYASPSATPGADASSGSAGRMGQLLRDLDEDIRQLKNIKTVTPSKNMLLYVPQDSPYLPPYSLDRDSVEPSEPRRDDGEYDDEAAERHNRQRRLQQQQQHPLPPTSSPNRSSRRAAPDAGATAQLPLRYNERLCALEQAVASLTQSLQHQREDLTMIKRLLLQQATERRREIEKAQHHQQQQQQQRQQADGWRVAAAPAGSSNHTTDPRLRFQQVDVDFPEDALRAFVESVLAEKLHKYAKKSEAKTLARLDTYLEEVVSDLTSNVDQRVRGYLQQQQQQQQQPPVVAAPHAPPQPSHPAAYIDEGYPTVQTSPHHFLASQKHSRRDDSGVGSQKVHKDKSRGLHTRV